MHGLGGSYLNIFLKNPVTLITILAGLIINTYTAYATMNILNSQEKGVSFYVCVIIVVFSASMINAVDVVTRKNTQKNAHKFLENIHRAIDKAFQDAPHEFDAKYNVDKKYEAKMNSMWCYDNITEYVTSTITQTVRSVVLSAYIVVQEPALLLPLIFAYICFWKYIIPSVLYTRKSKNLQTKYASAYYAVQEQRAAKVNPQFRDVSPIPDVAEKFMDITRVFGEKMIANDLDSYILKFFENIIVMIIVCVLLWSEKYAMLVTVLMNRCSLFGVIDSYIQLKKVEKSAEKSTGTLFEMLNDIENCLVTQIPSRSFDSASIDSINIYGMNLGCVSLLSASIQCRNGGVLLLDGPTGCGKSVTINALAGLYSQRICESVAIVQTNGNVVVGEEFSSLLNRRCYIDQHAADNIEYNGGIKMTLGEMFPARLGAKQDIVKIRNFLTTAFNLKQEVIPHNLNEMLPSTLSGGEKQRFSIAWNIWRIIHTKSDFIILDEIDRALDADTAVTMMKWIVNNVNSFFIIVTHLSEVKKMLYEAGHVNQIWNYKNATIIPTIPTNF